MTLTDLKNKYATKQGHDDWEALVNNLFYGQPPQNGLQTILKHADAIAVLAQEAALYNASKHPMFCAPDAVTIRSKDNLIK